MINVLSVNDGACTVLRPWPERAPGPMAIIDCGAYRAPAIGAAETLWNALDGTLAQVDAFVVSHFDADHWHGLAELQAVNGVTRDLNSCTLYYPAMPKAVPAALMAMIGPQGGTGIAVLDLEAKLRPLLRPGQSLKLCPLTTANGPIRLASDEFEILWPPPQISAGQSRQIHGAISAVEQLADHLSKRGSPGLRDSIESALRKSADSLTSSLESELVQSDHSASNTSEILEDDWELEADWEKGREIQRYDPPQEEPNEAPKELEIPSDMIGEYGRVLKRIRRANNNLSLVLASTSGSLICFGDIGGPALTSVISALPNRSYRVGLMPHHGTHPMASGMPAVRWCIAQDGPHHHQKWLANHAHPLPHKPACWSTNTRGSFRL